MLFYTVGQSRVFLAMLYAGLAVGLYAWLDSAARRLFEAGPLCRLIMDLLLGAAAAVIILAGLMIASDGEMRLYALMGAACGYLIFSATLAPLLNRLGSLTARGLGAAARWISGSALGKKLLK